MKKVDKRYIDIDLKLVSLATFFNLLLGHKRRKHMFNLSTFYNLIIESLTLVFTIPEYFKCLHLVMCCVRAVLDLYLT